MSSRPAVRDARATGVSRGSRSLLALRAEASKLASFAPWWWLALGTIAVSAVLQVAFATAWTAGGFDADTLTEVALRALAYVQPAFVALGVLAATSEYQEGQATATFAAMPSRVRVVLAKAIVAGVGVVPVATAAVAVGLGIAWVTTAPWGLPLGALATAAAAIADAVASAVAGVALGFLARSMLFAAGAAAAYLALVAPLLREALPWSLWLPATAGYRVVYPELFAAQGPAWAAALWLVVWPAVAIGLAAAVVERRDA